MASSAIHGLFPRRLPTAPMAVRNAENGGPAGGRTVTVSENPRPSLPGGVTSPCHCRLRFLISCSVRALAGPRKSGLYTAGPFTSMVAFQLQYSIHAVALGARAHCCGPRTPLRYASVYCVVPNGLVDNCSRSAKAIYATRAACLRSLGHHL